MTAYKIVYGVLGGPTNGPSRVIDTIEADSHNEAAYLWLKDSHRHGTGQSIGVFGPLAHNATVGATEALQVYTIHEKFDRIPYGPPRHTYWEWGCPSETFPIGTDGRDWHYVKRLDGYEIHNQDQASARQFSSYYHLSEENQVPLYDNADQVQSKIRGKCYEWGKTQPSTFVLGTEDIYRTVVETVDITV